VNFMMNDDAMNNDAMNDDAMNNDAHQRARKLIAVTGPEELSNVWLAAHLETCDSCRAFSENVAETILRLRAIPVAAQRSLVAATQMRVRYRALELQRQRERLWLVSVSCIAVTLCALFSAIAMWRGFAWLGVRAQLPSLVWQVGFLVFCVMPALVTAILLLARGTQFDTRLSDHTGTYQG
jgi:predicted anti-sigma-YlaC factor YlaD